MADRLFSWRFAQVTEAERDCLFDRKARSPIGQFVVILSDRLAGAADWIGVTIPRPFFWLTYRLRDLADERIVQGVARRGRDGDPVSVFVQTKTRRRLRVDAIQVGIGPLVVHEAICPDPFAEPDLVEWTITHRPTGLSAIPGWFDNLCDPDSAIELARRIEAVIEDWSLITDKKIPKEVARPILAAIRKFYDEREFFLDEDTEGIEA